MIDGATCDAANTAGCGNPPARSRSDPIPSFGTPTRSGSRSTRRPTRSTPRTSPTAKDPAPSRSSTAPPATPRPRSGCDQTPATAPAGFGATGIAVDPTTNQRLRHQHRGHQRHHDQRRTPATAPTTTAATTPEPDRSSATTPARSASTPSPNRLRRRQRRHLGHATHPLTRTSSPSGGGSSQRPTRLWSPATRQPRLGRTSARSTSDGPVAVAAGRGGITAPGWPRRAWLLGCVDERLPVPRMRRPLTPPDHRHITEREARRSLQPAERNALDQRQDGALKPERSTSLPCCGPARGPARGGWARERKRASVYALQAFLSCPWHE